MNYQEALERAALSIGWTNKTQYIFRDRHERHFVSAARGLDALPGWELVEEVSPERT